jgi:small subunit ribosomal protein S3Ae
MAKITSKKKKWYPVLAPKLFNKMIIGETFSTTPDSLINKHLNINLMNITGDRRSQNINILFKIVSVDNNAFTQIVSYSMANSSIKRLVRRGNDRIDNSFVCETSDGVRVRLKPFLLTISRTKRSIKSTLRKKLEELSINEIKKVTYDNFLEDLVSHKFQQMLRDNLKKIYPLRVCEIREMKVEKEKKKRGKKVKEEIKKEVEKEIKEEKE